VLLLPLSLSSRPSSSVSLGDHPSSFHQKGTLIHPTNFSNHLFPDACNTRTHYIGERDEETLQGRGGAATSRGRSERRVAFLSLRRESCRQTMQTSSLPGLQYVNSPLPLLPEHRCIPCGETPVVVMEREDKKMSEDKKYF